MSTRTNLKRIYLTPKDAAKRSYYEQKRRARARTLTPTITHADWEIAASAYDRKMIYGKMGEIKGMDTDLSVTPIVAVTNTNASAFCLNLIQSGAASWNRVGRKTHIKSLRIVGNLLFNTQPTAAGSAVDNFVRMVVVWDKQISGAAIPTFDTVFGITDQSGVETCPDITCPPKYDNMDRFKVLSDCIIEQPPLPVQSFAGTAAVAHHVPFDKFLKIKNLESVYSTNSSPMTIADISTGALYVYFRCRNNIPGQSIVTVDAIGRLRYTD